MKRLYYLLILAVLIFQTGLAQLKNTDSGMLAKSKIFNLDTVKVKHLSGTSWTELIRFVRTPESVKDKI